MITAALEKLPQKTLLISIYNAYKGRLRLPLTEYEDYYVDIADPENPQKSIKKRGFKTSLPKIYHITHKN